MKEPKDEINDNWILMGLFFLFIIWCIEIKLRLTDSYYTNLRIDDNRTRLQKLENDLSIAGIEIKRHEEMLYNSPKVK